jgi:hypothetical protein
MNITELLEKRAKYNERLQNEPDDIETRKKVERIDEEVKLWDFKKFNYWGEKINFW